MKQHANIPFFISHLGCPHHCSFCNQHSINGVTLPPTPQEVQQVCKAAYEEIENRKSVEIAFFGGSFTAIPKEQMLEYLECVQPFLGVEGFFGIRISTRPDGIHAEILERLKQYGVTTIELGAQSMSDTVLLKNERGHSKADVIAASHLITQYGFSLGLQMMTGLYGSNEELDLQTAEELIALKPDCVRIYPTVVLKGTKLESLWKQGAYQPMNVEASAKLCATLLERFYQENITVLRCGLHADETLQTQAVAGAYHPAFRELAEGYFYRKRIESLWDGKEANLEVWVNDKAVSKAIGQKKCNLLYFQQRGLELKIRGRADILPFEAEREQ